MKIICYILLFITGLAVSQDASKLIFEKEFEGSVVNESNWNYELGNGWPKSGEIDIMEYVGKNPHEIHSIMNTQDSHGQSKNTKITTINNIEEDIHIYKAHWNQDIIEFFIANEMTFRFSPNEKNENTWLFNQPFYVILNMAIGVNFGGPEVEVSIFPQKFVVDCVKVFKN